MKKVIVIIVSCIFILCSSQHPLSSKESGVKPSIVLVCRPAGLFSNFDDVLSLCKFYEKGLYSGIEVNFGKSGLYYEASYGPNWWNYYCEPISCGSSKNAVTLEGHDPWETELRTSREEAWDLIQKYIFVKKEILEEVDKFCEENFFGDLIVGVHYRGTDKKIEVPRVSYEKMVHEIQDKMSNHEHEEFKIFVATDEENFVNYMVNQFGENVCYVKDTVRSTNGKPTHYIRKHPYQCGKDAMIDALILSRCDILIKTSSNLSRWSTYFNPTMPVYEVSKRY